MWSNTQWHWQQQGFLPTLKLAVLRLAGRKQHNQPTGAQHLDKSEEVLNLQPGELVEVKSEPEILATLDENRKYKGLLWMCNMHTFCGKRYRVYKRLERILLESTGELKKVRNTVLLKGVMCDGKAFQGCDRSCFHFWREAWLRRVNE